MKIIPVKTRLNCDSQPRVYWAVLFPDVCRPDDLVTYRNALTESAKTILCSDEMTENMNDVIFSLIQMAEFIATGIDEFHDKKTTWEQFARTQLHELAVEVRRRREEGGHDEAA